MYPTRHSMPPYQQYVPSSDPHTVATLTELRIGQHNTNEALKCIKSKQDQILQEVRKPARRLPEWLSPQIVVWIIIIFVSLIANLTAEKQKQLLGLLDHMPK